VRRIIWSHPARWDIEHIREFIDTRDPYLFALIAVELVSTARFIASAPKAAPLAGSTFERKWRVKKYPYLIFYRIQDDEIRVSRVRHMAEDWKSEFT
jgi:plasmid stabilization system protein ParE